MKKNLLSVLVSAALVAACLAGCNSGKEAAGAGTDPAAEKVTEKAETSGKTTEAAASGETKKLVFWDKAEYVGEYAALMKDIVDKFSKEKNVQVDYVNVASSDMKQKLMAAIEAGNAPDLIVGDNTLVGQFGSLNQLAEVDDIMSEFKFTDAAMKVGLMSGKQYMVPLAFLAPGMYVRNDVWEKAGLSMPKTWEELKEQAAKVNDPKNGFYALGFAMGASGGGDAEGFVRTIILDWGGRTVDENGNVVVNSPETVKAFEFIKSLYQDGLISPDGVTGDDSWNNQAYLSGTAGVICNSGSVIASMKKDNPDLLNNTQVIPYPAGPGGDTYVLGGSNTFGIISSGANTETAKDFIRYYFSDLDNYEAMIEIMGAMWQPVIEGFDQSEFWQVPANKPWLESSQLTVNTYYPAPSDDKAMTCFSNQLCVKAVQNMLVNGASPEEAVAGLEKSLKEVYK